MATHDYVLDNATGANFRSDLNNALAAIVSNNSSSTEPSTKYAYQWWADTNEGVLKIRNSSNDGWVTLLQLDGTLTLEDGTNSAPALGFRDDLNTGIFSSAADTLDITCGGTTRGSFSSSGLTVTGDVTATTFVGNIDAVDGDFDGTLEADAITVAGTALSTVIAGTTLTQAAQTNITSLGTLTGLTLSGDMTFQCNSGNIFFDKSDNALEFSDNVKATFGGGTDLEIFHNGSQSKIIDTQGNELRLNADTIRFRDKDDGDTYANFIHDGAVEIFHDNGKVLTTESNGVQVLAQEGFSAFLRLYADEGDDNADQYWLKTEQDGTGFHIQNNVSGSTETNFRALGNGAVELYFDNTLRLETRANDVKFHGGLVGIDNAQIQVGNSADLKIYHDGTDSYVDNIVTGKLRIRGNSAGQVELHPKGGQFGLITIPDGAVECYHSGNKKLETTSSGINVTGAITVNGSALSTGGGKILQVKNANKPDQFDSNSTSFVDVASLSIDITAASSSNKMLVTCHVFANCEDSAVLRLMFDSTPVGNGQGGDGGTNNQGFAMVRQDDGNLGSGYGIQILHTPGDTSQHTYKIQARTTTSNAQIVINRRSDNLNFCLASSITVMEVSA